MTLSLQLPGADGALHGYTPSMRTPIVAPDRPAFNRIAYSAAHVGKSVV